MTNVVALVKPPSDIAGALAILDSLREAVQSGQIIALRGAITALMQEVIDS